LFEDDKMNEVPSNNPQETEDFKIGEAPSEDYQAAGEQFLSSLLFEGRTARSYQ
jgi:hypothetical protein